MKIYDNVISSFIYTLRVLFVGFVSMDWSAASESMILGFYLILPDRRDSCNSSEISWSIFLVDSDQLRLHLTHNKFFGCFRGVMAPFELVKHTLLNDTS